MFLELIRCRTWYGQEGGSLAWDKRAGCHAARLTPCPRCMHACDGPCVPSTALSTPLTANMGMCLSSARIWFAGLSCRATERSNEFDRPRKHPDHRRQSERSGNRTSYLARKVASTLLEMSSSGLPKQRNAPSKPPAAIVCWIGGVRSGIWVAQGPLLWSTTWIQDPGPRSGTEHVQPTS